MRSSCIALFPFLCLLVVHIATSSPIPHRPTEPPNSLEVEDPVTHNAVHGYQAPHRFQALFARERDEDQRNNLYRRKNKAATAHPQPAAQHTVTAASPPHSASKARPPPSPKQASKTKAPRPPPATKASHNTKPQSGPPGTQPPKKPSLGQRIKAHFQRLGQKMKAGWQKFKAGAKNFFHKVGEGIKTVGLKIAKFAVKAAAVVTTWAGKAVGVLCKPLGRAIEAGGRAGGALADKLNSLDHHQSVKEQKAWKGLDIAQKPMEYAAKAMEDKARKSGSKAAMGAAKAGGAILQAIL